MFKVISNKICYHHLVFAKVVFNHFKHKPYSQWKIGGVTCKEHDSRNVEVSMIIRSKANFNLGVLVVGRFTTYLGHPSKHFLNFGWPSMCRSIGKNFPLKKIYIYIHIHDSIIIFIFHTLISYSNNMIEIDN